MYFHLGRGNVIIIEDILAITDFERLTSFKEGQNLIDDFLSRDDMENPALQFFPQSLVFVLEGIEEINEKSVKNPVNQNILEFAEKEEITFDQRILLMHEQNKVKRNTIIEETKRYNKFVDEDDKFSEGGEFFLTEKELIEERRLRGKGDYERIISRITLDEEEEVDRRVEEQFPYMKYFYQRHKNKHDEYDSDYYTPEYFCNASLEEVKSILPNYNMYEKCRMIEAFRLYTENEYGEEYLKEIEETEGIGYVLGYGKIYLYGKKIYYPDKKRLYVYVSEYTPSTLLKRLEEEIVSEYYVDKEN